MAKSVGKRSILEAAAKITPSKGGPVNWLDELKRDKSKDLAEILDLLDDWLTVREFTASHSRASLARFITSLDCCNRKDKGVVDLLRRLENGEIKTASYR